MFKTFHQWQLQEAKNKFSQVVNLAIHEGPQVITLHGREAAVLLSADEFKKLTTPAVSLKDFFQQSPLADVELDLQRDADLGRDVDL